MQDTYNVYVRADGAGRITDINSSAFLEDLTGWTQIDQGVGDRYHHAQGNYLPGPLTDTMGRRRYKMLDGAVVARTEAEIASDVLPPVPPSPEEAALALAAAQIKAVADRSDFVEDCIAEMAMVVYGNG